jgi:RelB Antitoxin alpha helical domain
LALGYTDRIAIEGKAMFEVSPRYILNQDQQPIAVQIPIEQFQQITGILEASGQVLLMREVKDEEVLEEDETWIQADLSNLGSHEPYDWRPGELEEGLPVKYVPGKGLMIDQ